MSSPEVQGCVLLQSGPGVERENATLDQQVPAGCSRSELLPDSKTRGGRCEVVQGRQPDVGQRRVGERLVHVPPRAATQQHCRQAGLARRQDVVLDAVADVGDLGCLEAGALDDRLEEGRVRLLGAEVVGSGDEVSGQVQLADELAGPRGLVARDADDVAAPP